MFKQVTGIYNPILIRIFSNPYTILACLQIWKIKDHIILHDICPEHLVSLLVQQIHNIFSAIYIFEIQMQDTQVFALGQSDFQLCTVIVIPIYIHEFPIWDFQYIIISWEKLY